MNRSSNFARKLLRYLVFGIPIVTWFRWARKMEARSPGSFGAKYIQHLVQRKFSCYLSPKANVGSGLVLKHPVNIVIGEGVNIGRGVIIYQGVTLGAKQMGDKVRGYPVIGNEVTIYAGACVVGDVNIGDGAIIGAGAVVTKDVPPGAVAVGAGFRLVQKR